MLSLSEIKVGRLVKIDGEPYAVIKAEHHKMGRGGAVLKTKLRNVISGNVLERTFQGSDRAEEAETETKTVQYLYKDETQVHLMDNDSFEQFSMDTTQLGDAVQWLKEGENVDVLYFDDRPVAIKLPPKVELTVTSAPPGVKGNSAGNVTKMVTLETGAEVAVPMFINEGDVIRVNTDTGDYAERA